MTTRQYLDSQGDLWNVLPDGRLTLQMAESCEEPLIDTFADVDRQYGPLEAVDDGSAPVPDVHRALDDGQYKPQVPAYYKFPHGTQVIEISRYLTSNAGQAVQYIARSSRLDGNNKGDRVGDLRKAVNMMLDEIERLEAEKDAA